MRSLEEIKAMNDPARFRGAPAIPGCPPSGDAAKAVEERCEPGPLGLRPRHIHERLRLIEVLNAMIRYAQADKQIPNEWVEEVSDLVDSVGRSS